MGRRGKAIERAQREVEALRARVAATEEGRNAAQKRLEAANAAVRALGDRAGELSVGEFLSERDRVAAEAEAASRECDSLEQLIRSLGELLPAREQAVAAAVMEQKVEAWRGAAKADRDASAALDEGLTAVEAVAARVLAAREARAAAREELNDAARGVSGIDAPDDPEELDEVDFAAGHDKLRTVLASGPFRPFALASERLAQSVEQSARQRTQEIAWWSGPSCLLPLGQVPASIREEVRAARQRARERVEAERARDREAAARQRGLIGGAPLHDVDSTFVVPMPPAA